MKKNPQNTKKKKEILTNITTKEIMVERYTLMEVKRRKQLIKKAINTKNIKPKKYEAKFILSNNFKLIL
jgi:hypothetical protein